MGVSGGLEDLEQAARLLPAEPPSRELAIVLASLANTRLVRNEIAEAQAAAERAVAVARTVGDRRQEASAHITLGTALTYLDEADAGLAALEDGLRLATETGDHETALRAMLNISDALELLGRHEEAAETAARGLAEARRVGLRRRFGVLLTYNLVEPLFRLGRWAEAERIAAEAAELDPLGTRSGALYDLRGAIARRLRPAGRRRALRGDGAEPSTRGSRSRRTPGSRCSKPRSSTRAATWPGRAPRSRARSPTTTRRASPRATRGRWSGSGCAPRPTWRRWRATGASRRPRTPAPTSWCATPPACRSPPPPAARTRRCSRPSGRGSPATRPATAGRPPWAPGVRPPSRTGSPTRCCGSGRPRSPAATGRRRPRPCARHARSPRGLGPSRSPRGRTASPAAPGSGSTRAREPAPAAKAESAPFDLTDRELEVLRQVAAGLTNREIGAALYMSPKTASVHVSRIFVKLGVSGRVEAATLAHRHGLIADED